MEEVSMSRPQPVVGEEILLLAKRRPSKKIEIWPLIARSYRYLLQHLRLFWRIGWFWFGLTLLVGLAGGRFLTTELQQHAAELLDLPLVIAFAVAWHRATLLREIPTGWIGGHLGRREARYAGWVLFLILASFIVIALGILGSYALTKDVTSGVGIAVALGLLIMVILVATRFILLLPAVALGDHNAGLMWSWKLTRGHSLALFCGFCAVSLPLVVLKYAIVFAVRYSEATGKVAAELSQGLALLPIYQILDFANMAISIAFMSFAYEVFTRK
jgi:hypothetical protein